MESAWDQLTRHNLPKENYQAINRAKDCLRALALNLTNLENQNVFKINQKLFKDKRKLQVAKKLKIQLF